MQAHHSAVDKGGDLVEVASEWLLGELTDDPQKDMGPLRLQSLYTSGLCLSPTLSRWKESNAGRNRGPY